MCKMCYLLQVLFHKPRNLWTALKTTKSCSFPDTPSHQLKRSGGYFLSWCCNTHNNRCSPALKDFGKSVVFYKYTYHLSQKFTQNTCLMAALQSRPHHWDISNALKTVVNTTVSEINNNLLNWFLMVLRIHKFSHSKFLCCMSQCNISK